VHIVIHTTGLGIPATSAVNILAFTGGANIAGRLVIGSAIDRIGSRLALVIGLSVMLASLAWLQFAEELWMLYLFGTIFGFAWGGSSVPMSPLVAELFGLRSHGVLFGFVDIGFAIGATVGPVLIGYIFDVTSSYQLGFLISAGLSIIGLILTLLLKPTVTTSSS
jgi:MFS family permease